MNDDNDVVDYFEPDPPLQKKSDVLKLIKKSRIDLDFNHDEDSNTCLSVGDIPFGSLGNFTLIAGKAKSKKTFLVSLIAASACSRNDKELGFTTNFPKEKVEVIYIDTEQSVEHVKEVANRICRLTGQCSPPNLHVYCLRPFSPHTRRLIISQLLLIHKNAGLIVIDGARDLVSSVNDEYEASKIAHGLLKISQYFNVHIITILHENKGNTTVRGHLGTELVNKAETVFRVKKKSNLNSVVSVTYSRKQPVPSFSFRINEDGLPQMEDYSYGDDKQMDQNEWVPDELTDEQLKKVLKVVSKLSNNESEYSYSNLLSYLKDAHEKVMFSIGDNRTKDLLKELLKRNLINKHGKERSPNAYYTLEY